MNTQLTPEAILQQITQIQRMDRGTLSIIRQGPKGPYYNHQCYENGRNISRYVPAEQVAQLKDDLMAHHRFQELVTQYVQLVVEKTRAARQTGVKKKIHRQPSSSPKIRKSSS